MQRPSMERSDYTAISDWGKEIAMTSLPDIFSRRRKPEIPDAFQYGTLPDDLRIRAGHILRIGMSSLGLIPETVGRTRRFSDPPPIPEAVRILRMVRETLLEEYGVIRLAPQDGIADLALIDGEAHRRRDDILDCEKFFQFEENINRWLDFIELILCESEQHIRQEREKVISTVAHTDSRLKDIETKRQYLEEAISKLNARFRQAGFGFQYERGQIIRMDRLFTHTEIMRPTLYLLADERFANASDEFHQAHKHYRAGNCREAVINASNAVESVLKIICKLNQWGDHDRKSLGDLIKTVIRQHSLIPDYCQCGLQALSAIRNQDAAHGQGATPSSLTEPIAGYALHLAATNIVLLVKAFHGSDSGMQSPSTRSFGFC